MRVRFWILYLGTVLALSASIGWAGLINRPTKTCGTTSYTDEVANGCATILAAEVDADLNTIYGEFNGGISNDNIASGANIACSKIQANSCPGSVIQNGAICSAQIGDGCIETVDIADEAVTSAKIADGTIATDDIANSAITRAKIDDGALAVGFNAPCATGPIGTAETTIATLAIGAVNLGNVVMLSGQCSLYVTDTNNHTSFLTLPSATVRWKRNGTTLTETVVPFGVVAGPVSGGGGGTGTTVAFVAPLPLPTFMDGLVSGGAITYTLTAFTDTSGATVTVGSGTNSVNAFVLR